jgi:iron(III) transport system substrate-binding protein
MMRALAALLVTLLFASCGKGPGEPPPAPASPPTPSIAGDIVVFAAEDTPGEFDARTVRFTDETGVRVSVRRKPPADVVDDVIADRGRPPADVVITPDVAGAWRAADTGALLPLAKETLAGVPSNLRDPDNYWAAVDIRLAAIVYDPGRFEPAAFDGYEALGGARFGDQLCLSSSANALNRALIAMLIDTLDARPAEVVVRGWMANLALAPLAAQADVIDAIRSGRCAAGIIALAPGAAPPEGLAVHLPEPAYGSVRTIGVARHARNPDAARRFVAWYLGGIGATLDAPGLAGRNVGVAGRFDEEARLLAERAGYR